MQTLLSPPTEQVRALDVESLALTVGAFAFAGCAIIAAFVFWGRELAIDGRGSLGDFTAIAGAVAATAAFVVARLLVPDTGVTTARVRWFDLIALALAHGVITLLAWIGLATIMDHSFSGATVFASPAVAIAAAATALSAYGAFLSGSHMSAQRLSVVLAVFLVVGMLAAMLSSADPRWWEHNLSALGITRDISALAFNLTLIISGILVTLIARFGTASLAASTASERRRKLAVRTLFVMLGVLLACVGIFPVDRFFLLHNTVATGMSVAFAILVVGLPWLAPTMPKVFVILGFVYVAVIAVLGVLFAVGVYNLTAVELVAALLIFSWIILFLRNVQPHVASETGS